MPQTDSLRYSGGIGLKRALKGCKFSQVEDRINCLGIRCPVGRARKPRLSYYGGLNEIAERVCNYLDSNSSVRCL
jgi:hypothetical protein